MAGAAVGAALIALAGPAGQRASAQPAPPLPAAALAAPAETTPLSLVPVSPGAIDVLLGIKPIELTTVAAASAAPADAGPDLADAPDLGSVPTAPVDPASVLASGFVRPVEGPITSRFGPRFHPILQVWKLHTGTDIGAACGTPVKAAKDGTITSAGVAGGYGNRVVIDQGQGLSTTYNHLTSYAATVGMPVRQGQVIGYVGTTGLSTGCHLHFEVLVNGVLVDSGPYLDLAPAPKVTIPPAVAAKSGVVAAASAPPAAPAPVAPASPAPVAPAPAPTTPAPPPTTPPPPTPTPTPPTSSTPTPSTGGGTGSSPPPPAQTAPAQTCPPAGDGATAPSSCAGAAATSGSGSTSKPTSSGTAPSPSSKAASSSPTPSSP